MIYVRRPPSPEIEFEQAELRLSMKALIRDWLDQPTKHAGKNFLIRFPKEIPGFKGKLRAVFNNKCAYCEAKIGADDDDPISYFRPQEGASQELISLADDDINVSTLNHYSWLSWEWFNIYLACRECRLSKDRRFPVESKRAEPGIFSGAELWCLENPLLLDPCLENPLTHLDFREDGQVSPKDNSKRGAVTIEILNLNRAPLRLARQAHAKELKDLWRQGMHLTNTNQAGSNDAQILEIVRNLELLCDDSQPFAGIKRRLLKKWLDGQMLLGELSEHGQSQWQKLFNQLDVWLAKLEPECEQQAAKIIPDKLIETVELPFGEVEQTVETLKSVEALPDAENFSLSSQKDVLDEITRAKIEGIERQLKKRYANLNKLREQAANYSVVEVPLHLMNQIEAEEEAIESLEVELSSMSLNEN